MAWNEGGDNRVREDVQGSGRGLILMYYPRIYLDGLKKTRKISVRIAGLWTDI
jgi:hypothetical protein